MKTPSRHPAWLALEDGSVFEGFSCGAPVDGMGEVVFNTSMAGYQEVLSDPSYKGQMVVMTVSHLGNYGINPEDLESEKAHVEGFIVREACWEPSNWRSKESLPDYLKRSKIPAIEGIDTRAITAILRQKGALRGVISVKESRAKVLVDRARHMPRIEERDLVTEVSCAKPYEWNEPVKILNTEKTNGTSQLQMDFAAARTMGPFHVVVVDCGVKYNILRSLVSQGCRLTVVPAFTPADKILHYQPDGVVFSNGPGDPDRLPVLVKNVRAVGEKVPTLGICLGHQVIGKAFGGRTYKLKFGHHGGNHPVKTLKTGAVAITVQNHNFAVDPQSLPSSMEVTHVNLNDGTVEGQRHKELPLFSVQYHPESSPGPHDAGPHFREFVEMIAETKGKGAAG